MRNGNLKQLKMLQMQMKVLTVPMRNGNDCVIATPRIQTTSSYRTYEEWKRYWTPRIWEAIFGFLPYLWGMETQRKVEKPGKGIKVLTVPMRNGNSDKSDSTRYHWSVLTVPMRNGNYIAASLAYTRSFSVLTVPMRNGNERNCQDYSNSSRKFLPYLWGMETTPGCAGRFVSASPFLPYLWGMETAITRFWISVWTRVLTVPMRNGNACFVVS